MPISNHYSNKEAWVAAVSKIFNGPESEIEDSILALYTTDVTVTANGSSMRMAELIAYVKNIRNLAPSVEIMSHYFLRDGNLFADKHTVIGTGHDGSKTQVENLVIGELNEQGKCFWIEEQSRFVERGDLVDDGNCFK
jgi:hypothetical protein